MYENLMEEVVSAENYGKALKAVIVNKGAPGIDGMTTEELNGHLLKHFPKIHSKLMAGTYVPTPVRRKEIDKQGGGKRKLGIPTVLDRFIQQMLLQAMTPIWEPRFSEHTVMGSGRGEKQRMPCEPRKGMPRGAPIGSWIWISPNFSITSIGTS
jgi:retron-type reverse transcriptase